MKHGNAWKGECAGYDAIHKWIKAYKPRLKNCEHCGQNKKLEAAFRDHSASPTTPTKYTRNFEDWAWLCHQCHMLLDGRKEIFAKSGFKKGNTINLGTRHSEETRRRIKESWIRRKKWGETNGSNRKSSNGAKGWLKFCTPLK